MVDSHLGLLICQASMVSSKTPGQAWEGGPVKTGGEELGTSLKGSRIKRSPCCSRLLLKMTSVLREPKVHWVSGFNRALHILCGYLQMTDFTSPPST